MKVKYAFSMIELTMVIVVMGIVASLAIPRMDRDLRQEAIDSIMSDIMLTQRLALSDDRHDPNNSAWQKTYWKWRYSECSDPNKGMFYIVTSNRDYRKNADQNESAIDSYNQKYLYANSYCRTGKADKDDSERVLITKKFGIVSIDPTGGCRRVKHIAFDELGRPHHGIDSYKTPNFEYLMQTNCNLTFNFDNGFIHDIDSFTLTIEAITGRVFVAN